MGFLELVFVGGPYRHDPAHIHFIESGEHRGGVLRILEAPGNGLPEPGHPHDR